MLAGTSYRAEAFLRAAKALGVDLVLATDLPAAFERLGCTVVRIDFGDPEAAAAALAATAHTAALDGVVPTDEASAIVSGLLAARLRLPGPSVAGVRAARDKRLMRRALRDQGVPSPGFVVLDPGVQPSSLAGLPAFPCVVKAPMLTGSQGVIRADDVQALRAAVARVRAILERSPNPARDDPNFHRLLIEDYLHGAEVAVEALMTRGTLQLLAIFDKPDELVGPFFEETLYVTPSRLPPATLDRVLEVTARAARALGLLHGPLHAELRVGPQGPFVVEVAARSVGGLCSRTLALVARDLERVLVAHAAGLPLDLAASGTDAAGVMMIPIPRSGVLRGVDGVEAASRVEGIDSVTITARPGHALRTLPEGSSYLGFIFARGPTPAGVEAALREAHSHLSFDFARLL